MIATAQAKMEGSLVGLWRVHSVWWCIAEYSRIDLLFLFPGNNGSIRRYNTYIWLKNIDAAGSIDKAILVILFDAKPGERAVAGRCCYWSAESLIAIWLIRQAGLWTCCWCGCYRFFQKGCYKIVSSWYAKLAYQRAAVKRAILAIQ